MLRLRHIPLRYRLPLIHQGLSALAQWRSRTWVKAIDADLRKGDFIVSGFFNESLGIGQGGRLSARAFRRAGYATMERDLRPAFRHLIDRRATLPGDGGVWYIHANPSELLVALLTLHPSRWANRYRIGYWAWETPKAPASWVFAADYLHEIWVPSDFVREAVAKTFKEAGREDLVVRLRTMPHPVTVPVLRARVEIEAMRLAFGLQPERCEVLALFDTKSSATRKNPWGSIDAWTRAFPEPTDAARLTLKVSDLEADRVSRQRLEAIVAARPDIQLVNDRLSEASMEVFFAGFDVLLSLHRSEGFGLPMAEAMAVGVPVIATGWSGNLTFMTAKNAKLIPAGLVRIDDLDGPYTGLEDDPDQVWGEPDIESAAKALRDLAKSASARKKLGQKGRKVIDGLHKPWQAAVLSGMPFHGWLRTSPHSPARK